jgi:hypothetical protein
MGFVTATFLSISVILTPSGGTIAGSVSSGYVTARAGSLDAAPDASARAQLKGQ